MSECTTFEVKGVNSMWEFSVKPDFLKKCANPTQVSVYDLLTVHKMTQYLNNPSGPAIWRKKDDVKEYWIEGQRLSKEEGERIAHNFQFNNKLMDIVSDEAVDTVSADEAATK